MNYNEPNYTIIETIGVDGEISNTEVIEEQEFGDFEIKVGEPCKSEEECRPYWIFKGDDGCSKCQAASGPYDLDEHSGRVTLSPHPGTCDCPIILVRPKRKVQDDKIGAPTYHIEEYTEYWKEDGESYLSIERVKNNTSKPKNVTIKQVTTTSDAYQTGSSASGSLGLFGVSISQGKTKADVNTISKSFEVSGTGVVPAGGVGYLIIETKLEYTQIVKIRQLISTITGNVVSEEIIKNVINIELESATATFAVD